MFSTIISDISSVFGIMSGLYFIFKYFYNRKIQFYLFVNKVLSGRREVHFKLSVDFLYNGSRLFQNFEKIADKYNYNIELNMKNHKMYNFNGILIDVMQQDSLQDANDTDDNKDVFIKVVDAGVTLKTGLYIIKMFGSIIGSLCDKLNVQDHNYNFQILYDKRKNPFIGMKLKTMSQDNLLNFSCAIKYYSLINKQKEPSSNKPIDINKNNVSINDNNYSDLSDVAEKLLIA